MTYILLTNNTKDYLIRPESYQYFYEVRGYRVDAIGNKALLTSILKEIT